MFPRNSAEKRKQRDGATVTTDQTWSFTFLPSTSMVFTLKSMPVRQQRRRKGKGHGEECRYSVKCHTQEQEKDTPTYIVGYIGRSHTPGWGLKPASPPIEMFNPILHSHPHVWRPYQGLRNCLGF